MNILLAFISGVVFWTLLEYMLHRFLGHVHKGKNFFKSEHLTHHIKVNYFAPASKKAMAALVVTIILFFVIQIFMGILLTAAFLLGLIGMYLLYEMTHYRYHSKEPVAMPFIVLRKHHFYHHFHNPKTNFGVTTRFWDRMFGTFVRVEKVVIPKKFCMKWLLQDDLIKPAFSAHFRFNS